MATAKNSKELRRLMGWNKPDKYKTFSDKFHLLCEEHYTEDFEAEDILKICKDIIDNFSG